MADSSWDTLYSASVGENKIKKTAIVVTFHPTPVLFS
jgi:hypothetical protein